MTHAKDCPWKKGFRQVLHDRDWGDRLQVKDDGITLSSSTDPDETVVFQYCPMCGVKLHG